MFFLEKKATLPLFSVYEGLRGGIIVASVAFSGVFLCFIRRQLWACIIKIPDKFSAIIRTKVAWEFELSQAILGFRWAENGVPFGK